jgi:hypothetical protein
MFRMARPTPQPTAEQKAERIRDQVLALDVKRVADWIQALVRTVKAMRMYLPNNPSLHKFQTDLESRTWAVLKEIGDITLTVQQFDFLFENYSVYHNAAREESIAFRFHSDGVREMTIKEGLEVGELRGFLDVVKRATEPTTGQDDVVTLLWERDFRHLEYVYVPLEDLMDARDQAGAQEGGRPDQPDAGIPWPAAGEIEPETATVGEGAPERSDDWSPAVTVDTAWDEAAGPQFKMTDAELGELDQAIKEELVRPLGPEVLEIVAAILESEEEPSGFLESAVAFQRFIELAIEDGDLPRANALLARLKTITAKKAESRAEFGGLAEQVIREIGRPSFLAQAAPTLNSHPEIDPGVLTNFLVQLGSSAAPAICDLLGQLNHMKHRRALCEALATSCRDDVEVLISRLGDSRWYVIRNVVYVLGRIAHQGVERALDRALHHEDVRVRKEAVRALGRIESSSSRAYLISAFRDSDAGVRVQAALTLASKRDERAAQAILGVIGTPDFGRRDLSERQAFYEALGRSGSDALVAKLEPVLTKGSLFRSGSEDDRFHAALALAWLGTPAALGVLNRELQGKKDGVKKAVEAALAAVRSAGGVGTKPETKSPVDEEGSE